MLFWPYDEVVLRFGSKEAEIFIDSPWLKMAVAISEEEKGRAEDLIRKFESQTLGANDLEEIRWFFSSLAKYPFCYVLPRPEWPEGSEPFSLRDTHLLGLTPKDLLTTGLKSSPHGEDVRAVSEMPLYQGEWKWDAEAALQFSRSPQGIDPLSLFSVARRFHLLSFLENDGTNALFTYVRSLRPDPAKFEHASALMVRQNHYVTERCQSSLEPALENAQGARAHVQEFIAAEYGHDRILRSAMRSMGKDPSRLPILSETTVLMDLLKFAAERNFLAFAMVVDCFERSAYQESDPLAQVLEEGGLTTAARQINRHMEINDAGEHENVALGFLSGMGPVVPSYAEEALRIAELTSNAMNLVSSGVHRLLTA